MATVHLLTFLLALFCLALLATAAALYVDRRRREALFRQGTPVSARFEGVEQNTSIVVKGRSPFRVVAQWLDPSTSKVRIFHSENLWFDPTEFIPQEHLTVFVDPRNPQRYCVDLSFLPKRESR